MKKLIIAISCLLLTNTTSFAEKVVVIPLGGTTNIMASINWKGVWSEHESYKNGDAVESGGSSYLCVDEPDCSLMPPADSWDLMAAKGLTGEDSTVAGPIGPDGPQGPPGPVAGDHQQFIFNNNGNAAGARVYNSSTAIDGSQTVRIGESNAWGIGENRGIQFGDADYVYIGERVGDNVMTLRASGFYFENGNVGIGTRSPDQPLHVIGNSYFKGNVGIGTRNPNEHLEVGGEGRVFIGDGGGSNRTGLLIDGNNGGNWVTISPYDYLVGRDMALWITSKVGIGTNTPLSKLDVRGEIRATDDSGQPRIWGSGRPRVAVNAWSPTTTKGYKQGPGNISVSWDAADAGCPAGTWVCSKWDYDETETVSNFTPGGGANCDGSPQPYDPNVGDAWVTDMATNSYGYVVQYNKTLDQTTLIEVRTCEYMSAMCCKMP